MNLQLYTGLVCYRDHFFQEVGEKWARSLSASTTFVTIQFVEAAPAMKLSSEREVRQSYYGQELFSGASICSETIFALAFSSHRYIVVLHPVVSVMKRSKAINGTFKRSALDHRVGIGKIDCESVEYGHKIVGNDMNTTFTEVT